MDVTAGETWRPVIGYEASHEVSDRGRVRSLDRWVQYIDGRSRFYKGHVLGTRPDTYGHHQVHLGRRAGRKLVHCLVAEAFLGPAPAGHEVRHGVHGKADNSVANLEYGTRSQNMLDAVRDGTDWWTKIERCPRDHPLEAPNLVPSGLRSGRRQCLACCRARNAARHARIRHGITLDVQALADRRHAEIVGHSAA